MGHQGRRKTPTHKLPNYPQEVDIKAARNSGHFLGLERPSLDFVEVVGVGVLEVLELGGEVGLSKDGICWRLSRSRRVDMATVCVSMATIVRAWLRVFVSFVLPETLPSTRTCLLDALMQVCNRNACNDSDIVELPLP